MPLNAGVLSAIGLLVAPVTLDAVKTRFMRLADFDRKRVSDVFEEMREQTMRELARMAIPESAITFERSADMRYVGQGYEVTVPLPPAALTDPARLAAAFYATYRARFGRHLTDVPLEVLSWRLKALARGRPPGLRGSTRRARRSPRPKGTRAVYYPELRRAVKARVYDHYALEAGMAIAGPAIVEQRESTTVLGRGDHASVSPDRSLLITIGGRV